MTRILIADPDPRIRQALVLLLERRLDAIQASEAWDRASLEYQLAALAPMVNPSENIPPGTTRSPLRPASAISCPAI